MIEAVQQFRLLFMLLSNIHDEGKYMIYIVMGMALLSCAVIFLFWQMTQMSKEQQSVSAILHEQEQHIHAQEEHLKQTLHIMQDLAKKMHVQQEGLDKTTQRVTQVEVQNAELIRLLQQKFLDQ